MKNPAKEYYSIWIMTENRWHVAWGRFVCHLHLQEQKAV